MTNDDLQKQLVNDLLIESFEGLDRFDRELLVIENGASTPETMNIIFRVIHTIKGTAGCLGLSRIESLAHVGENLLSCVREGKVSASSELISALLALSDALRDSLRFLEAKGVESDTVYTEVIARLQQLQPGAAKPSAPAAFGLFGETNPPIAVAAPCRRICGGAEHSGSRSCCGSRERLSRERGADRNHTPLRIRIGNTSRRHSARQVDEPRR